MKKLTIFLIIILLSTGCSSLQQEETTHQGNCIGTDQYNQCVDDFNECRSLLDKAYHQNKRNIQAMRMCETAIATAELRANITTGTTAISVVTIIILLLILI